MCKSSSFQHKLNVQNILTRLFKEFYEINKLELNEQQVKIINSLEKFLENRETILSRLFKKKKNFAFIFMEK